MPPRVNATWPRRTEAGPRTRPVRDANPISTHGREESDDPGSIRAGQGARERHPRRPGSRGGNRRAPDRRHQADDPFPEGRLGPARRRDRARPGRRGGGAPAGPRKNGGAAAMAPDVPVDETHPAAPATGTAEGQPGAATIADVPAGASVETATGAEETTVPDAATGRRAAAAPASPDDRDLRPGEGEAAGALRDFSDLTYRDLIPDAAHYTAQCQQI